MTAPDAGERRFLDSNVWLYALISNSEISEKHKVAHDLTAAPGLQISSQVVNEVCRVLIRKASYSEQSIRDLIASFYHRYSIVHFDPDMLCQASILREKHGFSYWDSLIVCAALKTGADVLYSEDMHHGMIVDNRLQIRNPFKPPTPGA